jgi:hypothetical protein
MIESSGGEASATVCACAASAQRLERGDAFDPALAPFTS